MPEETRLNRLEKRLDMLIQHEGLSIEDAYQTAREDYLDAGASEEALTDLDLAYENVKERLHSVERLTRVKAIRARRAPWYGGPAASALNWNAYRSFLLEKGPDWAEAVESIDDSSTQVVSMLYNPGIPKFESRGLVLGYVQSGKTANMTAVIAKAADAGYKLIVVLTGMIEDLRRQTQERLETDLTKQPGVSHWEHWTTEDEDFNAQPANPGFQITAASRNIMVVKKNKDVLQRIIDKQGNSSRVDLDVPVLVIDDECDQASVNSPSADNDWKTINRLIREMLDGFPRHSYVGYTATPFANVLIDPSVKPSRPQDLYPKDFIYTLPTPADYFGAERLFGRDLLDAELEIEDDGELDVVRLIPDKELPFLRQTKDSPDFSMTGSIEEALDYFLLATAIRDWRGQRAKHSTMLVHTSHLRDSHTAVAAAMEQARISRVDELRTGSASCLSRLKVLYEEESKKVPPTLYGYEQPEFEVLLEFILSAADSAKVVVVNSESDDKLIYGKARDGKGFRYICVGGNVVSRGLTLDGLVTTFFMRTSKQYDTLMQMGRWFGYRHGFEDLPRIWMTADMKINFTALATVEADIREKIRIYEQEDPDITPMDVAVKIRQIPGLAVTARNKMRSSRTCRISFAGEHRQTTHFAHRDAETMRLNWEAAGELLEGCARDYRIGGRVGKGFFVRGVARALIETFLSAYSIHPSHHSLVDHATRQNHLLSYLDKCKARDPNSLSHWNVVVVQKASGATGTLPGLGEVKLIGRSLFQELRNGDADIKALMSKSDITVDMEEPYSVQGKSWHQIKGERAKSSKTNVPLLLLYPIDKDSEPQPRTTVRGGVLPKRERQKLNAVHHVLGMGILFPSTDGVSEASSYVEVILPDLEDAEEDLEKHDQAPIS